MNHPFTPDLFNQCALCCLANDRKKSSFPARGGREGGRKKPCNCEDTVVRNSNHVGLDTSNLSSITFPPDIFNQETPHSYDDDITRIASTSEPSNQTEAEEKKTKIHLCCDSNHDKNTLETSMHLDWDKPKELAIFCDDDSSNSDSSSPGGDQEEEFPMVLPLHFAPTPYTVVCGELGKKYVGNRRLQVIASMFVKRYGIATRRKEKSAIVSEIMEMVQEGCPKKEMAFVRYSEGRWWTTTNLVSREKIGAALRDCLHQKYKSSNRSKLRVRHQRKMSAKTAQKLQNYEMVRNNPKFQLKSPPVTNPP